MKSLYHKLYEKKNEIGCGEDPALVPWTTYWPQVRCQTCIANKRAGRKTGRKAKAKKHVFFGHKKDVWLYARGRRISQSLSSKFGVQPQKKLKFGDTFSMIRKATW